jgi:hypothetical protein
MKTKLLSKLMLMGFAVGMIAGCGGGSDKKNLPSKNDQNTAIAPDSVSLVDPCNLCEDAEHIVSVNQAKIMIEEFHRRFIDVPNNRLNNIGGIIDLTNWRLEPSGAAGFRPLKMHYGLDKSRNLILTVETVNTNCYDNNYQGSSGFQSAKLLTTNSHFNPIKRGPLTREALDLFLSNELTISASFYEIERKDAEEFHKLFDDEFHSHYACPSMYFFPANSIDQISSVTNNKEFAYFFGYDNSDPDAEHKLRVILVGINAGRLVMTDGQNSLMRDYSRPHPIAKSRKTEGKQ